MSLYDQYSHQQVFAQSYESEQELHHPYPVSSMASFDFNTTATQFDMAFSYCDNAVMYAEAPVDNAKYPMVRSPSNTSTMRSYHEVPALHASGSVGSTSSSTVGSPYSSYAHMMPARENYHVPSASPFGPAIVDEAFQTEFVGQFNGDLTFADHDHKLNAPYVDPVMISSPQDVYHQFQNSPVFAQPLPHGLSISQAPSPVPSHGSYHTFSKPVTADNYNQSRPMKRESSASSSLRSINSPRPSLSGDEENADSRRCPHPDCGKRFKDLKAHMLTHESVRPQQCPIVTCEYHKKGFARKYDRNRHTLTHYKGTMVCGFCPGSGTPTEKSFNRADVFKRHLTSVHQVEQNPPNSRKRSPGTSAKKLSSYCQDATGKCSTCSGTFNNAQDFYEHLDDCVLRVVQRADPSEAINAQLLTEVTSDPALQATLDRNQVKLRDDNNTCEQDEDEEEDEEEYDDDEDDEDNDGSFPRATKPNKRAVIGGGVSKSLKPTRRGMTWSRGGVALVGKGRKRRKNYPPSWGMSAEKMKMKKRVLCVYDGPRRLLKDDMMLNNEFEVRMKLADGHNYVTDLDVVTMKRAEAYHHATSEEKGPWIQEQDFLDTFMG